MLKFSRKNEQQRQQLHIKEYQKLLKNIFSKFFLLQMHSSIRKYITNLQQSLNSKTSYTKTRNVCLLTGRARSVYRLFKLSRAQIREYSHNGYFIGISKAS